MELKGEDVKKASEQLLNTINSPIFTNPKKYAFVVASKYPKTDTNAQKNKVKFKQKGFEFEVKNRQLTCQYVKEEEDIKII